MARIETTGNRQIDQATAEIALALRDANPGGRDQEYYEQAQRLRDEIRAGQQMLDAEFSREHARTCPQHQVQMKTFSDGRAEVSIIGNGPLAPGRYRGTVVREVAS